MNIGETREKERLSVCGQQGSSIILHTRVVGDIVGNLVPTITRLKDKETKDKRQENLNKKARKGPRCPEKDKEDNVVPNYRTTQQDAGEPCARPRGFTKAPVKQIWIRDVKESERVRSTNLTRLLEDTLHYYVMSTRLHSQRNYRKYGDWSASNDQVQNKIKQTEIFKIRL